MKEHFRGFYSPKNEANEEIWNNHKTLFIFDANCLLNLYRCENQTREDIFLVMESVKDRSWFPFQCCYEYQKNRIKAISDSVKNIQSIKKTLIEITTATANALSNNGVKRHLYAGLEKELGNFKEKINEPIKNFIEMQIDPRIEINNKITKSDFIRSRLDTIVGNKCGSLPTQEVIDAINIEGEERYKNKIPPGFEDEKKEGFSKYSGITFCNKFGDLYLWKEIICRSKSNDVENVIFITDDKKKDWWFFYENNKTKGPLEALQTEIYNETAILNFKLLTQSSFLHEAQEYLKGVNIEESSVEEIKQINYNYIFTRDSAGTQYDIEKYLSGASAEHTLEDGEDKIEYSQNRILDHNIEMLLLEIDKSNQRILNRSSQFLNTSPANNLLRLYIRQKIQFLSQSKKEISEKLARLKLDESILSSADFYYERINEIILDVHVSYTSFCQMVAKGNNTSKEMNAMNPKITE